MSKKGPMEAWIVKNWPILVTNYDEELATDAKNAAREQDAIRAELLAACIAQQGAIDVLFAKVIKYEPGFRPTKDSAWLPVLLAEAAIARARGEAVPHA